MNNVPPEWGSVVLRLMSEVQETLINNKSDGIAIITAHIVVDSENTPLFWVVQEGKRVEPTKDAKENLIAVLTKS
jgi:hypothetical protein